MLNAAKNELRSDQGLMGSAAVGGLEAAPAVHSLWKLQDK